MSEKIQVETKDILIGQANIISEYAAEIDRLRAELAVKTDALEKIKATTVQEFSYEITEKVRSFAYVERAIYKSWLIKIRNIAKSALSPHTNA